MNAARVITFNDAYTYEVWNQNQHPKPYSKLGVQYLRGKDWAVYKNHMDQLLVSGPLLNPIHRRKLEVGEGYRWVYKTEPIALGDEALYVDHSKGVQDDWIVVGHNASLIGKTPEEAQATSGQTINFRRKRQGANMKENKNKEADTKAKKAPQVQVTFNGNTISVPEFEFKMIMAHGMESLRKLAQHKVESLIQYLKDNETLAVRRNQIESVNRELTGIQSHLEQVQEIETLWNEHVEKRIKE